MIKYQYTRNNVLMWTIEIGSGPVDDPWIEISRDCFDTALIDDERSASAFIESIKKCIREVFPDVEV
jgi:hypothetical protein